MGLPEVYNIAHIQKEGEWKLDFQKTQFILFKNCPLVNMVKYEKEAARVFPERFPHFKVIRREWACMCPGWM